MEDARVTEKAARSFLLGDVDDSERERIESLFLTDSAIRESILLAEDSLLDDYLDGSLPSAEAEKFRRRYASDSTQQRKLRIAQSIRQYAIANSQTVSASNSVFDRLRFAWPRFDLRVVAPVFVALAILVIIAAVWIAVRNRAADERNQQAAIEQQLADLNSPASLNAKPPQMISTTLAPVSFRSVNSTSELTLKSSSQVVELNLLWTQREEYMSYQAELSRVGRTKVFKLPPLSLQKDSDGRRVRLRLPADLLEAGLYRITLTSPKDDGTPWATEEYDFLIKRP
jgi:hypothetical protein